MEKEYGELAIKTPIFHGDRRVPPALIGTAEGWINPEEVCAITSGVDMYPQVADVRDKKRQNQKAKPGGFMTVLHLHSGDRILVMGTPREIRQQLITALSSEEDETLQESPDNDEPRDTNEPPEEPNEPSQSEEEGGK